LAVCVTVFLSNQQPSNEWPEGDSHPIRAPRAEYLNRADIVLQASTSRVSTSRWEAIGDPCDTATSEEIVGAGATECDLGAFNKLGVSCGNSRGVNGELCNLEGFGGKSKGGVESGEDDSEGNESLHYSIV
jgi:hypothetical protein